MPVIADHPLLRQVSEGSADAFTELYQRYHTTLYHYLLRLIHEPQVAEDILQEVFIAVWQDAGRFRGRGSVKNWLFRIAHNQAVSWLRKHKKLFRLEEETVLTDESLENQGIQTWRADQVRQALDQLSPRHRGVIELAFIHEFSYTEIAKIVGCPLGTVKSRMSYAIKRLNGILKAQGLE